MKYLSFIHKPELRFHYRFLSVQHRTKKWSFENLPPCDLAYDFLSRSFRFFSHFWPVVWHLWRFNSALIRRTCNWAVKHQLYIEFDILARDGMNVQLRRVSPSWRARAPAIVLSSYQIEVTLANHFKRLQPTSSAYLKVGMSLIEHRYSLWKYAWFWPLHTTLIIVSRSLSRRILSKNSLALQAQFVFGTIYNVWKGRRKREAKFQD